MNYMPQLDGLRAIAVFSVLYTHFLPSEYWLLELHWGGMGVRLFFVLSGFLITGILLTSQINKKSDAPRLLKSFYARRFIRLTPVFLLTITVAAMLDFPNVRDTFWWHALYLSNVKIAIANDWLGPVAHFWSLAVEEQFYLLWPFFVVFFPIKKLKYVIVIGIVLTLTYRYICRINDVPEIAIVTMLPDSIDSLMIGSGLALFVLSQPSKNLLYIYYFTGIIAFFFWSVIVFTGAIIPSFEIPDFLHKIELSRTLTAFYFSAIVLWASNNYTGILGNFLSSRPLVFLGKISYGIYVTHFFVQYAVLKSYHKFFGVSVSAPVGAAISTFAVILVSSILWFTIELPSKRFKDSLVSS